MKFLRQLKNEVVNLAVKVSHNDIVVRSVKTGVQAFVGVLVAGSVLVKDVTSAQALLSAAYAAAVSAAWNSVKEYASSK